MKSIKSILALFVAVLLMSTTTYAQRPTGQGAKNGNGMVEMMTKELGLSDVQIEQITVIQDEFTETIRSMRSKANGDKTVMREQMQKATAERETAIATVLTEKQREKLADLKAERSKRPDTVKRPDVKRPEMNSGKRPVMDAKGKRPPRGTGKRPQEMSGKRLQKALGLSDTQAKELKKLTKAHQAKIKDLQASGKERKIKRAKKKYHAAVEKLLTAEQFKKWTSIKAEKRGKKGVKRDIIH